MSLSATTLHTLDRCIADAGATARVYLHPVGLLSGRAASAGLERGALPLAGGPLAMTACEVLVRGAEGPATAVVARVDELATWAPRAGAVGAQVARLLEQLAAARPYAASGPRLMGVVNVTPDSFSDGGEFLDAASALARCEALLADGAQVLDIGGESTRPGALPVPAAVELERVRPVLESLRERRASLPGVEISIDTRHAAVMRFALGTGVDLINDVTALTGDAGSLGVAAASGAQVVLMHMQGTPETMNVAPAYRDVALDVYDYLEARVEACVAAGIERSRLVVDPGIGFGKRGAQNVELMERLSLFHGLGCPVLLGVSRKGLGGGLETLPPDQRLPASLAAAMHALAQGVQILRVHDVAATRQVVELWRRLSARA
jgi:dihydropteroate synthase